MERVLQVPPRRAARSLQLEPAQDVLIAVEGELLLADLDGVAAVLGQQHTVSRLRAIEGRWGHAGEAPRGAGAAAAQRLTLTLTGITLPSLLVMPGPTLMTCTAGSALPRVCP